MNWTKVLARIAGALAWTAFLVVILYFVDRGIFGPTQRQGWIEVTEVDAVPRAAGAVKVPAYLPQPLVWPPDRIFYRTIPLPGWWVEVRANDGSGFTAWLGNGDLPAPEAMGGAAQCLDPAGRCPEDWHLLSTQTQRGEGPVVQLITNVPAFQARRIIEGLRL